jgi:pyruvate/2-oxoglutarate dehydrogenase complex dihydrolipoamide acyltransferase (E2) component
VHASDMIGGTRLHVRRQNVQPRLVLMHRIDHARGQGIERFAVVTGTVDDLVVDVGDVAHVRQVIAAEAQPARDEVERHHAAAMAKVAVVVHGHPADVHAHLVAIQRLEGFFALGERVVDGKHVVSLKSRSPAALPCG